jgi:hypothetical protein
VPRVVPSQVRDLIEEVFRPASLRSGIGSQLFREWGSQLATLLTIADKIPEELLLLPSRDYIKYARALETIRHQLTSWQSGPDPATLPHVDGQNAVLVIYEVLKLCPDEAPSPETHALSFINNLELRNSIRLDISAANRDLVNHEYKGATVLAGSATEALLLWGIQETEKTKAGAIRAAVSVLVSAGTITKPKHADPVQWNFIELIEVARQVKQIGDHAAAQGKDFRNLIHPGRAARLGTACDRGTALAALAAVELVVRDLTP